MPSILAVRGSMKAAVLLDLDDLLDAVILNIGETSVVLLLRIDSMTLVQKSLRSQQRAKVLWLSVSTLMDEGEYINPRIPFRRRICPPSLQRTY